MNVEDYIASGILEQYCLGLCSPEERNEVEAVAAKHPKVRKILEELCEGIEAYAAAHSVPPPQRLKSKVIQGVNAAAQAEGFPLNVETAPPANQPVNRLPSRYYYFAAAASVAMLVLAGLAFMFYQNQEYARKELAAISQQVQRLQENYQNLDASHDELRKEYVLLKDVGTHHVQMQGSAQAPKAQCVVYWNPEHKDAYLNIVNLPEPPHGHEYQIWADVEGHHHNMGLLNMKAADPDSSFLHPLPYIENSQGFVITLEKKGGSPHPSVDRLFVKGNL